MKVKLMIILLAIVASSCYTPAPLLPDYSGQGLATTNCASCTMKLTTSFGTPDSVNFPSKTERMRYRYNDTTTVRITVRPHSDQVFNVRLFDRHMLQVYLSPDVAVAAGTEQSFTYQFKK